MKFYSNIRLCFGSRYCYSKPFSHTGVRGKDIVDQRWLFWGSLPDSGDFAIAYRLPNPNCFGIVHDSRKGVYLKVGLDYNCKYNLY
jgi:hypothetical protein